MAHLLKFALCVLLSLTSFGAVGSWNGIAFTAWNGVAQTAWNGTGISCATPYLINQNFEGTGYDHSESWTGTGSWNPDDTSSPAPLLGSQSARSGAATGTLTSPTFTAQSDCWVYFQINITTFNGANTSILDIRSAGGALLSVKWNTTNHPLLSHGANNSSATSTAFSSATKYHVWVHYVAGSGANGSASIGFSTDGTRPTSGNQFVSMSNGTATSSAVTLRFNAAATYDFDIDHILLSTATIGDNP